MFIFDMKFDYPGFDDLPPEPKSTGELALLILMDASGERVSLKKYNDKDVNTCAGKLIDKGFMRGTIFDRNHCSWSRLTRKGHFLKEHLKNNNISIIL